MRKANKDLRQSQTDSPLARLAAALERETSDGRALLHDIASNPVCQITVDKDVPCLFVNWQGYASSLQYRFVQESILALLQQHRVAKLLGDDTKLPMIHADDQAWIIENWLPRAIMAGVRAVAHKGPAAHFGKISVDNVKTAIGAKILLRTFESLDEARKWLKEVSV